MVLSRKTIQYSLLKPQYLLGFLVFSKKKISNQKKSSEIDNVLTYT